MWTVTVTLDKGSDTSGQVSVTWDAGGEDEFPFSKRVATSSFNAQEFKAEAEAARAAAAAKRTSETNKATAIAAVMNGA